MIATTGPRVERLLEVADRPTRGAATAPRILRQTAAACDEPPESGPPLLRLYLATIRRSIRGRLGRPNVFEPYNLGPARLAQSSLPRKPH